MIYCVTIIYLFGYGFNVLLISKYLIKKDYYLVTANAPIIIAMMTDAPKTNGAILMRENAVPEVSVIPSMIGAQAVATAGNAPTTRAVTIASLPIAMIATPAVIMALSTSIFYVITSPSMIYCLTIFYMFGYTFNIHPLSLHDALPIYYLVTANAPIIIAMMTDAPKTNGAILMRENAVPEVSVIPSMIGAQ